MAAAIMSNRHHCVEFKTALCVSNPKESRSTTHRQWVETLRGRVLRKANREQGTADARGTRYVQWHLKTSHPLLGLGLQRCKARGMKVTSE